MSMTVEEIWSGNHKPRGVSLPTGMWKALDRQAAKERRKRSQVIQVAVEEYLTQKQRKESTDDEA